MKRIVIVALLSVLVAVCSKSRAEEQDKIAFTLTSDFYTKYIWRGQVLSNGAVFQPSIGASYKGWTANIWGDLDMTDYRNQRGEFAEYDLTLDYSNKLTEKVGYSVGVIHYHFPSFSALDTTEIYWGFNFDVPLSPAIKVYHGLGNENGTYVNLSIGQTYEKVLTFTEDCFANLQWGASIGWANGTYNKDYWGVEGQHLNDLAFTLGLPISCPGGWTVKPNISYITLADGTIRRSDAYARSSDYFVAGVSISKSF